MDKIDSDIGGLRRATRGLFTPRKPELTQMQRAMLLAAQNQDDAPKAKPESEGHAA